MNGAIVTLVPWNRGGVSLGSALAARNEQRTYSEAVASLFVTTFARRRSVTQIAISVIS